MFLNIVLLILWDLVEITDPVFNFLLTYIKIVDILELSAFDQSILDSLHDLVKEHNNFITEFFKESLKPKHHFMVHYVRVIKLLGPLKYIWSFRYESKHQNFKKYSHIITSRVNLIYTLAVKNLLNFAFHIFNKNFFQEDITDISKFANVDLRELPFYSCLCLSLSIVKEVDTIKYKGIQYKKGDFVKINSLFWKIIKIIFTSENHANVICQEYKTTFLYHIQSFKIVQPMKCFYVKYINEISYPYKQYILSNGENVIRL